MYKYGIVTNQPERQLQVSYSKMLAAALKPVDNPIDEFLIARDATILRASSADELMLSLLLLHIISSGERYFRRIISELAYICPQVGELVLTQTAPVGAHRYYESGLAGLAVLEHQPLTDTDALKARTLKLLGCEIKKGSSVYATIEEFDRVCQLRHGIIHAAGRIGYNNLATMQVRPMPSAPCRVALDISGFQEAIAAIDNVVRAYNQFVFDEILTKWINSGLLDGTWKSHDRELFVGLYNLFISTRDGSSNAWQSAYTAYLKNIRSNLIARFRQNRP